MQKRVLLKWRYAVGTSKNDGLCDGYENNGRQREWNEIHGGQLRRHLEIIKRFYNSKNKMFLEKL